MSQASGRKMGFASIVIAVVVCWILLHAMSYIVQAGHRGVVFSKVSGIKPTPLTEGFHLITPFFDHVTPYEVRTRTYAFEPRAAHGLAEGDHQADMISAKDFDQQTVYLDVTVRYHVDPDNVAQLHIATGPDYEEKVVRVMSESTARTLAGGYSAEQIYSVKRQELQDRLAEELRTQFAERHIVLDEVLIRNVSFTPEYQQKIEQKQIALQRAQMKGYELQREQKEKVRKTIEAKAEGEAIRIEGEALARYPSVVQYDFVSKIPDNTDTYVVTGDTIVNLSDLFGKGGKPAPQQARQ